MSKTIARALASFSKLTTSVLSDYAQRQTLAQLRQNLTTPYSINTGENALQIVANSKWSVLMCEEFSRTEPDTRAWITAMGADSVLWDIGANIGLFSLYAAKKGITVLAFEPAVSNYAACVHNIRLNALENKVQAFCLAFSDKTSLETMHMTSTDDGTALHAIGGAHNQFGSFNAVATQPVLGLKIDDFVRLFKPALPTHIKLDVDSIELQILQGAPEVLAQVHSVLIEIEGLNAENDAIITLLNSHGLQLDERFTAVGSRNKIFTRA